MLEIPFSFFFFSNGNDSFLRFLWSFMERSFAKRSRTRERNRDLYRAIVEINSPIDHGCGSKGLYEWKEETMKENHESYWVRRSGQAFFLHVEEIIQGIPSRS